jgi:hypothetical protein
MKTPVGMAMCLLLLAVSFVAGGEKTRLRFLAESVPADLGEVVWMAGGKEGGGLQLAGNQLSAPINVPDRVIGLQSKQDRRKLGVVTLPAAGDSFVVLLIPEPAGTLKSVVIDANPRNFHGGDVFLYNHSDRKIGGHLGATEFELAPGEGMSLRAGGDLTEGNYNVAFNVREETGDRVLRTMRWPVQTRSRSYGFFFRNPGKDRIEFRAVDEFVEPAKEQIPK